jgi:transposase
MDTNPQPVVQRGPRGKYRQHSLEFKRSLVEMSLQPGVSVARLAREHGVNANQVFSWRKMYEAGQLVAAATTPTKALLPVVVATPEQVPEPEATAGTITLEIGRIRLRIEGQANAATLAQVLERVLR